MEDSSAPILPGYCQCSCGGYVGFWTENDASQGRIKGEPKRFAVGHNSRRVSDLAEYRRKRQRECPDIPYGYCHCGCGDPAPIARQTDNRLDHLKGQPTRFLKGHFSRKSRYRYVAEDRGYETLCWIWQGGTCGGPHLFYGKVQAEGRSYSAHRYFYEQKYGPVPKRLQLDHLCRVTLCVNPEHLEVVTPAVNAQRRPTAKLSTKEVTEMRRLGQLGRTQSSIATDFGVSRSMVSLILSGKRW